MTVTMGASLRDRGLVAAGVLAALTPLELYPMAFGLPLQLVKSTMYVISPLATAWAVWRVWQLAGRLQLRE